MQRAKTWWVEGLLQSRLDDPRAAWQALDIARRSDAFASLAASSRRKAVWDRRARRFISSTARSRPSRYMRASARAASSRSLKAHPASPRLASDDRNGRHLSYPTWMEPLERGFHQHQLGHGQPRQRVAIASWVSNSHKHRVPIVDPVRAIRTPL